MLINLSNHPSENWSAEQIQKAKEMFGGPIVDVPFPNVPACLTAEEVSALADRTVELVKDVAFEYPMHNGCFAVHVMGEMTLVYAIVSRFRKEGIACVASTTERVVQDLGNGEKKSVFHFLTFRHYE